MIAVVERRRRSCSPSLLFSDKPSAWTLDKHFTSEYIQRHDVRALGAASHRTRFASRPRTLRRS